MVMAIFRKSNLKKGFTLAEVLITLGIIGVVAAMTIPTLIANAQKKATAMKVKAFYSYINQAVRLSIVDNEEPEGWEFPKVRDYESHKVFLDQYFTPYMNLTQCKNIKVDSYLSGAIGCAMNDGSGLIIAYYEGLDIIFVTDYSYIDKSIAKGEDIRKDTRHSFVFSMHKFKSDASGGGYNRAIVNKNFVIPYMLNWNGKEDDLKTAARYGCNKKASVYPAYCAKWIQLNNWEIPKDYPW